MASSVICVQQDIIYMLDNYFLIMTLTWLTKYNISIQMTDMQTLKTKYELMISDSLDKSILQWLKTNFVVLQNHEISKSNDSIVSL